MSAARASQPGLRTYRRATGLRGERLGLNEGHQECWPTSSEMSAFRNVFTSPQYSHCSVRVLPSKGNTLSKVPGITNLAGQSIVLHRIAQIGLLLSMPWGRHPRPKRFHAQSLGIRCKPCTKTTGRGVKPFDPFALNNVRWF